METIERIIRDEENAKQKLIFGNSDNAETPLLIFRGLEYGKIAPTDLDKIIKIRNMYVFIEAKHNNKDLEKGQRILLERTVKNFKKAGFEAMAMLVTHNVDKGKVIQKKDCKIKKIYKGKKWTSPETTMTIDSFIDIYKAKGVKEEEIYYTKIGAAIEMKNKAYMFIETEKDKEKMQFLKHITEILHEVGKEVYVLIIKENDEEIKLEESDIKLMNINGTWYKKDKAKIKEEVFQFYKRFDN